VIYSYLIAAPFLVGVRSLHASLAEATDYSGGTWTNGGYYFGLSTTGPGTWFAQSDVTLDGLDAAKGDF